jgi:prepilin-type N-terminal cleavage/methylation domain-containing protein
MQSVFVRRRAFTLIELLVVVSIIALLISILLPSLREAREEGKRALCRSNLHQIGTAMGHYFGEYSDSFPWISDHEYRRNYRSYQSWYYGGRYPTLQMVDSALRFYPENRPFNDYLYHGAAGPKAELKVYKCPSEDGLRGVTPGSKTFSYDPRPGYLTIGTSYLSNWWWVILSGIQTGKEGATLSRIPDYGHQMVRYKLSVQGAGIFATLYGDPLDTMIALESRYPGWHKRPGYSEVLFLDGHADWLLTDTSRRPWYMQPTWTLWWNVPASPLFMPAQFLTPYPGIEVYTPPG